MSTPQHRVFSSRRTTFAAAAVSLLLGALAACGSDGDPTSASTHHAPPAGVSFAAPADGAHVAGAVHVSMAASGVTIEPAGELHPGAGHFHVIADAACVDAGQGVPKDADHVHFGDGQTTGDIYLTAGEHTLCLQLGDGTHVAQPISSTIKVDVGVDSPDEWCAVSEQLEALTDAAARIVDVASADQFGEFQAMYRNATRLANQLEAGLAQVDPAHRDAMADLLASFDTVSGAVVDAADAAQLQAQVDDLFPAPAATLEEAGAWMMDTCHVSLTS